MSYTKLFSSLLTSTVWSEPSHVRIVWITMLTLANRHGEVEATIPGLARLASVSLEEAQEAVSVFLAPDPFSRTKDNDGRRVEEMDGGWIILNHAKYRAKASKEDQKSKNAARQQRFRERQKGGPGVTSVTGNENNGQSNAKSVTNNAPVTQERDIAEAEAEAESSFATLKNPPNPQEGGRVEAEQFDLFGSAPEADTSVDSPESPPEAPIDPPDGNESRPDAENAPETPPEGKDAERLKKLRERIGKILKRRPSTKWSDAEMRAIRELDVQEDEIQLVEEFYAAEEDPRKPLFRRTAVLTLCRHWQGEVDKARAWKSSGDGRPGLTEKIDIPT